MKNNNDPQHELARVVGLALMHRKWKIALAESCTGGLVCSTLTDLAGSSDWFECGYITYSNQAKIACLDVPTAILETYGAVSEEVAKAMATGAMYHAKVNIAISITGIAGPSGGSLEKPVGTVCFGWAIKEDTENNFLNLSSMTKHFKGDRQTVREQACDFALSHFLELLKLKNT